MSIIYKNKQITFKNYYLI